MTSKSDTGTLRLQRLTSVVFYSVPMVLISIILLVAVVINFVNVVERYLFEHAIFWTEEILNYMLMWSVFLGMVAVTYRGAHLNMDLLSNHLKGVPQRVLRGLAAITLIVCSGVVVVQSFKVITVLAKTGQVSVAASVPLVVPHASILVGFALVGLITLLRFRAYLTNDFD